MESVDALFSRQEGTKVWINHTEFAHAKPIGQKVSTQLQS